MTFRAPMLLWFLALAPFALVFALSRESHRQRLARRLVSERLRGLSNGLRSLRPWFVVLGLATALMALAGPRFGFTTMPIESRESNRVLILDVSQSMAAEDIGTSRLDAGKAIAKRIIEASSGRTALVVFESGAEVVSPLTTDDEAVSALLESVQPGESTEPGSDLGGAIFAALRLFDSDPAAKADLVIISDGEDQGSQLTNALKQAKQRGVSISAIAVGSTQGSQIPDPEGKGPLRDDSGQVVTTYAHPEVMERVASETGGKFYANPFGEHQLDTLAASAAGGANKQHDVQVPIDRFQWPLSLAFGLLFVGSLLNRGAE